MNTVARLCCALLLLLAAASPATAQPSAGAPPPRTEVQFSGGLLVGVPVGGFGARVDSAGGITGQLDVGLFRSIVSVGGEASYLLYGTESRELDLGAVVPELPGTVVTLTTDNSMILLHGRVRVQPRQGRWRPYIDGLFGINYIYTKTHIEGTGSCSGTGCDEGIAATNLDDYVSSVGAGVGVVVDVGRPGGTRLDASVRYLRGGEARYLTEGAIHRAGSHAVLDISRSRTDIIAIYFGVNFGR
jgi:hypothetical protein